MFLPQEGHTPILPTADRGTSIRWPHAHVSVSLRIVPLSLCTHGPRPASRRVEKPQIGLRERLFDAGISAVYHFRHGHHSLFVFIEIRGHRLRRFV